MMCCKCQTAWNGPQEQRQQPQQQQQEPQQQRQQEQQGTTYDEEEEQAEQQQQEDEGEIQAHEQQLVEGLSGIWTVLVWVAQVVSTRASNCLGGIIVFRIAQR